MVSQGSAGKRPPSQPWAVIKYPRWGMCAQYSKLKWTITED